MRREFLDDLSAHSCCRCCGLDLSPVGFFLATIYLREFSTSIFLYSPGSEPLGPLLYHFYVDGNLGPMCSLALVVSVVCMTLILIARKIGNVGGEF